MPKLDKVGAERQALSTPMKTSSLTTMPSLLGPLPPPAKSWLPNMTCMRLSPHCASLVNNALQESKGSPPRPLASSEPPAHAQARHVKQPPTASRWCTHIPPEQPPGLSVAPFRANICGSVRSLLLSAARAHEFQYGRPTSPDLGQYDAEAVVVELGAEAAAASLILRVLQ
jgi:hypothetical protein